MSVQLVGVQPMQESESVVANWTCEVGNLLHESSEGNALALARGGRAEGLASDRAATLRNRCSAVMGSTRTRFKWNVRVPSRSEVGEGNTPEQVSDRCTWGDLRRRGGGTATGTGIQSREGPCSETAIIVMRNANNGG